MKNYILIAVSIFLAIFGAGYALQRTAGDSFGGSGSQYRIFNGNSINGEVSVGIVDTDIVTADGSRTYLRICLTNNHVNDLRQVTLVVDSAASISHGRGFLLDRKTPCIEFVDATLVSGLIEGIASPSAASVSFTHW